jgi:AbrB family looped-hinge helix DNA binding protein
MPNVRVRPKHQITIPARIAQAANIRPDDILDISYANGVVILVPMKRKDRKRSVMDYAGIARGLWGDSTAEIDEGLKNDRGSWDR